jgi:hypothetical protein
MPRRRDTDPGSGGREPLRSSLAHAAWTVEDRVVWGAADVFRTALEAVKRPFERVAWGVEHWLVWPIQEETALWSRPLRAGALAGVALLAAAGVAAGIAVSNPSGGSGGSSPQVLRSEAPVTAATPVTPATPPKKVEQATGPVLHGSTPDFSSEHGGGVTKAEAATEPPAAHVDATGAAATSAEAETGSAAAPAEAAKPTGFGSEVAGPAAIGVAREFAGAFVLYETGQDSAAVKSVFHRTATPELAQALLKRPPRLPANVKVPKAKVVNIVAGPRHGDTYQLSVSLLRVGVTSELRIDMQKMLPGGAVAGAGESSSKANRPKWLVTDVLG